MPSRAPPGGGGRRASFAYNRDAFPPQRFGRTRGAVISARFRGRRGRTMQAWLGLARGIDALNERIGRWVYWLVLAMVLESAGNAIVRKLFNSSSNALLEMQWYLFSAVFLLCAGWTLLRNEHVRIDVLAGRFSKRTQAWIDIIGSVFFLLPMAVLIGWLSWPVFVDTFERHEVSTNAGGLIVWPARLMIPVGFALLALQGVSELIKRIAFLRGLIPDPSEKVEKRTAEEELAEEILRARGEQNVATEVVHEAEDRK